MALGVVIPVARQRAFDSNGAPLPGAKLQSWLAGTTTPQALYSDDALSVPLSNPVIADGNGYFPAMFTEPVALKLELRTTADVVIWNTDDITPPNLMTGVIATDESTGHRIGETIPAATVVQLMIGGPVEITAPDTEGIGLQLSPEFDASAQPSATLISALRVQPSVQLAASGNVAVYTNRLLRANLSTLGATYQELVLFVDSPNGANGYSILALGRASVVGLDVNGALRTPVWVTPPQITADQNNYAPTNADVAGALRLDSNASRNITGLAAGQADGRILSVFNIGAQNIVLVHASGSSTDVNRFALPGAGNFTITPGLGVVLMYDGISQRWRLVG